MVDAETMQLAKGWLEIDYVDTTKSMVEVGADHIPFAHLLDPLFGCKVHADFSACKTLHSARDE